VLQSDGFSNVKNQKKKVILGACAQYDKISRLAKDRRDCAPLGPG
jgi:hypothetical protein